MVLRIGKKRRRCIFDSGIFRFKDSSALVITPLKEKKRVDIKYPRYNVEVHWRHVRGIKHIVLIFSRHSLSIPFIYPQTSGKTTLLSVLAHGAPVETVPTIGLNVKVFKKGQVNMKCWDIGGQAQYRSEWSRYAKGCDVVLYVVDAAAPQKMATAKKELHKLLDDGSIGSTPLLVLANKIDIDRKSVV